MWGLAEEYRERKQNRWRHPAQHTRYIHAQHVGEAGALSPYGRVCGTVVTSEPPTRVATGEGLTTNCVRVSR